MDPVRSKRHHKAPVSAIDAVSHWVLVSRSLQQWRWSFCQFQRYISWNHWSSRSATFLGLPGFYARKQLLLSARLSHRHSVRPSVRLSHGWISQKRCKLGSPNLHRRLPGRLLSETVKLFHKFEGGHFERGRSMRGGGQNLRFFGQ